MAANPWRGDPPEEIRAVIRDLAWIVDNYARIERSYAREEYVAILHGEVIANSPDKAMLLEQMARDHPAIIALVVPTHQTKQKAGENEIYFSKGGQVAQEILDYVGKILKPR